MSFTWNVKMITGYLINGKANGLKVSIKSFLSSSILLHQSHQKGAPILPIQRIVIHILQTHHKLRVRCKCSWNTECCSPLSEVVWQNTALRHTFCSLCYLHNCGSLQQWSRLSTSLRTGSGSSGLHHRSWVYLGSNYRSPAWRTAWRNLNRTSCTKQRVSQQGTPLLIKFYLCALTVALVRNGRKVANHMEAFSK